MTPSQFKAARNELGLSQSQLGHILDVDPSTIRRWEMDPDRNTARPPNPVAVRVMKWMLAGYRPPEWPQHGTGGP